jgi:hypothetical protein
MLRIAVREIQAQEISKASLTHVETAVTSYHSTPRTDKRHTPTRDKTKNKLTSNCICNDSVFPPNNETRPKNTQPNASTTTYVTHPATQIIVSQIDHAKTCFLAGSEGKTKWTTSRGVIKIPPPRIHNSVTRIDLASFIKARYAARPRLALTPWSWWTLSEASSSSSQSNSSEEPVGESSVSEASSFSFCSVVIWSVCFAPRLTRVSLPWSSCPTPSSCFSFKGTSERSTASGGSLVRGSEVKEEFGRTSQKR